jgi:hypothetical protein
MNGRPAAAATVDGFAHTIPETSIQPTQEVIITVRVGVGVGVGVGVVVRVKVKVKIKVRFVGLGLRMISQTSRTN